MIVHLNNTFPHKHFSYYINPNKCIVKVHIIKQTCKGEFLFSHNYTSISLICLFSSISPTFPLFSSLRSSVCSLSFHPVVLLSQLVLTQPFLSISLLFITFISVTLSFPFPLVLCFVTQLCSK